MSRNWVFSSNNQSETILDADIPDEASFFREAIKLMNEYPDEDPARQGLEFVRVYMRTALQAAAREAHKLFTNAASGSADSASGTGSTGSSGANNSPYGQSTPKAAPPNANATVPWQSPAPEADEEDFDNMVDDSYQEPDEGDPYVVQDFDDDEEGATNYPESHNANMSALQTKEYVKGAVEISEDSDGDYTKNIVSRVADGRFADDDDGAAKSGQDDDDGSY